MILDEMLIPEIKRVYRLIERAEGQLSDEEKKEKHRNLQKVAKQIYELSNIAKNDGINSFANAENEISLISNQMMAKKMISLMVDGTDPEMVERMALMDYFSKRKDPYTSLINIMIIYGLLGIQIIGNPMIVWKMMNSMLPEDVEEEYEYEYQWTEDGEIEHGIVEKRTATDDMICYHCGARIKKNELITIFKSDDTYAICQKCSDTLW